jgi:hypothetical protein
VESPLVIAGRFNGPEGSGNGGYTCGLVAARVGPGAVEVTLRRPPPLDRPLAVLRSHRGVQVLDGDEVVAEGRPADGVDVEVPAPVSGEQAARAASRYTGFEEHHFPTCFVCGPARGEGDGLRVFAGPVEGRDGVVAAPWAPREVRPELVWAALDCPGAFAVGWAERGETVLGRMAADVSALPEPRERCVVMAWPLGEDGRKLYAGTALLGDDGRVLGRARQTWIVPR